MAKDLIYDGDILISNGDLVVQEDDNTGIGYSGHVQSILLDSVGQWYQHPFVGVGLRREINGKVNTALKNEIARQLRDDNFKINKISVIFDSGVTDVYVDADKG